MDKSEAFLANFIEEGIFTENINDPPCFSTGGHSDKLPTAALI